MGEHNDNPNSVMKAELSEAQKKYKAELEAKQAEFRKLLDSPITKEEADKELAENAVARANIKLAARQCEVRLSEQLSEYEARLAELDAQDAVIRRRVLNGDK